MEVSRITGGPRPHRLGGFRFPVGPSGTVPTSWWGRYPKSTNNLELFSTEELQIICGPWGCWVSPAAELLGGTCGWVHYQWTPRGHK